MIRKRPAPPEKNLPPITSPESLRRPRTRLKKSIITFYHPAIIPAWFPPTCHSRMFLAGIQFFLLSLPSWIPRLEKTPGFPIENVGNDRGGFVSPCFPIRHSHRLPVRHSRCTHLSFPLYPPVIPAIPTCHSRYTHLSFPLYPPVIPAVPVCHSRYTRLSFPQVFSGNPVFSSVPSFVSPPTEKKPLDSRLQTSGMTEGASGMTEGASGMTGGG